MLPLIYAILFFFDNFLVADEFFAEKFLRQQQFILQMGAARFYIIFYVRSFAPDTPNSD